MLEIFSKKIRQKGFTFIELLVVIAIIGILAGISMGALARARDSGKDARIINDMHQLRNQAELSFAGDEDYIEVSCTRSDCVVAGDGFCTCANQSIDTLCEDICAQGGKSVLVQNNGADQYCAEVQFNSGRWWCIDGKLRSKDYDGDPACDDVAGFFQCE